MFTKVEIKNFQSHKNTTIVFDKGINAVTGESDNGKTAVIRSIRWLVENRPLGTDKLNSHWNSSLKEDMSVKLYTDKGWVERIRNKDRNGYTICYNNQEPKELSAVGTDVPQEIKDFIKFTDVNMQNQLDSPYLISMTSGEASKYLNAIIHLDSIDSMLSTAEANKRSVVSEEKVIDKDIDSLTKQIEKTAWIEEAAQIQKRIDKYTELINSNTLETMALISDIDDVKKYNPVDFTEQNKLIKQIESISIPDNSELENDVKLYKSSLQDIVDFTEQNKLIKQIESISIPDNSELENEIKSYKVLTEIVENCDKAIIGLRKQLPNQCPVCGSIIKSEDDLCL